MPDDDEHLGLEVDRADSPRSGRIAFARIEALTLHASEARLEALDSALVAGTRIERHRRVWHMGQVRTEGRSRVGRIGFETGSVGEVWDDELRDFREEMLVAGTTSPFAINPSAMRVAFQLRPGLIRPKSFTGALQALMNEASDDRWRVYQELERVPFDEWVGRVERVVALRVRVERPNPHYGDRERVRELIEGANARMAELAWTADEDAIEGLDVGDPFIREAIDHSQRYGGYSATGERDGKRTQWVSEHEGAAEHPEVETDPATREVPTINLREQLGDTASGEPPDESTLAP